jgi:amino-acid N-acetyltransferase
VVTSLILVAAKNGRGRLLLKTASFLHLVMNSLKKYKVVAAEAGLRPAILKLLLENDLPVADLDDNKTLFACLNDSDMIGTGGLEPFGKCALLRSISVRKNLQKRGLGKFIVAELEKAARQMGINSLYLLTTTAGDFFAKEGYQRIDREAVPLEIKNTSEFLTICPSTAAVMRKFL